MGTEVVPRRQEGAPLSTRNPELLIDTLAVRLSQGLDERLGTGSYRAELVLEGNSFAITPIEVEPLSYEEALSAPLDTKVNLLVNGAAMLEKRKYEPPPLTRQEERVLDKNKGQIIEALNEVVEQGIEHAGRLIANRWGKRGLSIAGMTGIALAQSACSGRMVPIEPILLEPSVAESEPVAPTELPEPTREQLPTPIKANVTSPYPTTAEGLLIGAGGLENAEERIRELGAGPDIEKMKGMLIAEMNRTGINPETIDWEFAINEQAENPSWTMWSKDRISGQFLLPKLTSGPDEGQLIRSGNLFAYLDREIGNDFFDLVPLQNPQGFPEVEQRIIPDDTGWFVPGGFDSEGEILNWFSVDRDEWRLIPRIEGELALTNFQNQLREQGIETELVENEQGDFVWNHIDGQAQVEIGIFKYKQGEFVFIIGKEIGTRRVFSLDQVTIEQDTARLVFLTSDGQGYISYDPNDLERFRWSQVGEESMFSPLEVLDKDGGVTLRIGIGESLRQSVDWNGLAWNEDLVLKNYVDPEGKPHDSLGSQERLLEAWHVAIWSNAKYNGLNSPDLSLEEVRSGTKVNIRFRDDIREVDTGKAFNFIRSAGGLKGDYTYLLSPGMHGGININIDNSGSVTAYVTGEVWQSMEHSVDNYFYLTLLDLSMPSMTEGDQFFGILDYRRLKSYHPNIKTVDSLLELVFEIDRANIDVFAEEYSWLNVYAYLKEGAENNLVWPSSRSQ